MNSHKNARLTPLSREWIVRSVLSGQTPAAAARDVSDCPLTVRKGIARFVTEGVGGLQDRSSRPHRLNRPLSGHKAILQGGSPFRAQVNTSEIHE